MFTAPIGDDVDAAPADDDLPSPRIEIVRAYDSSTPDRHRVLVDRLWPRGVTKRKAAIDEWLHEVAPSTELRRWYAHEPAKFPEFARRYRDELDQRPGSDAVARLLDMADSNPITLVTATRDVEHSGARVLLDHLAALGPEHRRRSRASATAARPIREERRGAERETR